MAKQANLQGAIDKLRTSNEKVLGEVNDRSGEIAFNTRTTKNLIGDMLSGMMEPELPPLDGKNIPTEGEPADDIAAESGMDDGSMGLDDMESQV